MRNSIIILCAFHLVLKNYVSKEGGSSLSTVATMETKRFSTLVGGPSFFLFFVAIL